MALQLHIGFHFHLSFLLLLTAYNQQAQGAYTGQFKTWYPQLGYSLSTVLAQDCSTQYAAYRSGNASAVPVDYIGGASARSALTQPVLECILENVSNSVQSFMSSAQVLLGLTPTILAFLGTSTEEAAMMAVVGRRPLLSLLLALGSPSVYFGRAMAEYHPLDMLKMPAGRFRSIYTDGGTKVLINIVEYLVVLAAVVNVGMLEWQLGVGTICSFLSWTPLGPLMWSLLALPIHLLGCLVVRLRIRRVLGGIDDENTDVTLKTWVLDLPGRAKYVFANVFTPSAAQKGGVRVKVFPEEYWKLATRWVLTMCTIAHLIFGTLLLSSLLFLGPEDAVGIVFRYLVSVLACRLIVMYELAGVALQFHGPEGAVVNSDSPGLSIESVDSLILNVRLPCCRG